jgi:A/G-specific adenine glycosylase
VQTPNKYPLAQPISPKTLQKRVLTWFDVHGRKTLPWQQDKSAYRVWVSEIMLQQTQVTTVIDYFQRFTARFKNIEEVASALEDEVLHLWTGLGYYSRARNLHKTAKIVVENGVFPSNLTDLVKLPGIGRSTAGAILSIAFQQRAAILDGNVKRVLTRLHAIREWPGDKKTHDHLWTLAETYTPEARVGDYTQAMMDIGATLCIRGTPRCAACPLQKICGAHALGIAKDLPKKKPNTKNPTRLSTLLVILNHQNQALLEKRPPSGIWGGLWSLPEISGHASPADIQQHCIEHFGLTPKQIRLGDSFKHTFSHFHLNILPVFITLKTYARKTLVAQQQIWYNPEQPDAVGLPAPIKTLLAGINR